MEIKTTPFETAAIIAGIVIFVGILFIMYRQREQLSLTRNENGRLQLQE